MQTGFWFQQLFLLLPHTSLTGGFAELQNIAMLRIVLINDWPCKRLYNFIFQPYPYPNATCFLFNLTLLI